MKAAKAFIAFFGIMLIKHPSPAIPDSNGYEKLAGEKNAAVAEPS